MNILTQITSIFQFCPHICTYGRGNSKDSVPIFPATSSKVVGNGVINSSIYAPQYWHMGKETDGTVTTKPPLKSTFSGQPNTTIFFIQMICVSVYRSTIIKQKWSLSGQKIHCSTKYLYFLCNYITQINDQPNRPHNLPVKPEEEVDRDEKGPYIF